MAKYLGQTLLRVVGLLVGIGILLNSGARGADGFAFS